MIAEGSRQSGNPYRFCIAPMMDWTDRHERYLLRLISRRVRLYTEMVTTGALIHGDRERFWDMRTQSIPLGCNWEAVIPQTWPVVL